MDWWCVTAHIISPANHASLFYLILKIHIELWFTKGPEHLAFSMAHSPATIGTNKANRKLRKSVQFFFFQQQCTSQIGSILTITIFCSYFSSPSCPSWNNKEATEETKNHMEWPNLQVWVARGRSGQAQARPGSTQSSQRPSAALQTGIAGMSGTSTAPRAIGRCTWHGTHGCTWGGPWHALQPQSQRGRSRTSGWQHWASAPPSRPRSAWLGWPSSSARSEPNVPPGSARDQQPLGSSTAAHTGLLSWARAHRSVHREEQPGSWRRLRRSCFQESHHLWRWLHQLAGSNQRDAQRMECAVVSFLGTPCPSWAQTQLFSESCKCNSVALSLA